MAEIPEDQLHPVVVGVGQLIGADVIFGRLKGLAITGKYLWASDRMGDPYIHVIDLTRGVVVRSRVRDGEGPGELRSIWGMSERNRDSNAIWAFDIRQQRMVRISTDARDSNRTVRAPPNLPTVMMFWLGNDTIAALSGFDMARVSLLDTLGALVARRPAPPLLGDSVPMSARIQLSASIVTCVRPDHQMFALAYLETGRIELYGRDGRFLRTTSVPFAGGGLERDRRGIPALPPIEHLRYYYLGCSATNSRLYALFSGRHWGGLNSPYMSHGTYVHVFDWSGALVGVRRLPQAASSILVLGDSDIFAIDSNDAAVYRYPLARR